MKKSTPKVLSVILAVMLLCSVMSITAFAANDYTVTIYLETVIRDDDQTVLSQSVLNNGNPVVVTVDANSSLKAAVLDAVSDFPSILSNPSWTNDGQYLTSLTVGSTPLSNHDNFYYDEDTGLNTYIGDSWMYFVGVPSNIPATTYIYPSVSLLNATVTSNTTITLSYETQTFVW